MKTMTLKTENDFFDEIANMAQKEHISKSELIRKAIKAYQKNLEKQKIIKQMQKDSYNSRNLDIELKHDFEVLEDEHLLDPWRD